MENIRAKLGICYDALEYKDVKGPYGLDLLPKN